MKFSSVPHATKNQIKKAGKILVSGERSVAVFQEALDLANKWRACHAYPINTFQSTLRRKLKNYIHESIVAQRLKRMPTIIDKLRRYPAMQLTTMQDIGGVRAILNSVRDVYGLVDEYQLYKNNKRFAHDLINGHDYIRNPRSEDGYRSIHLIYRYKNKRVSIYDGLKIELQIRSKLQHIWATAVETMGTFLGQALKSRQGDREWIDFFAIVSSACAYKENCTPVPRFSHLSEKQTYQAVAMAEAKLGALEKMNGFSAAVQHITQRKGTQAGSSYYLIILNSLAHSVQVKSYDRESLSRAVKDYASAEAEATKGAKIEPVLVSADNPQRAYPNFFLDISDFSALVNEIICGLK
jgi:hypothetical protein